MTAEDAEMLESLNFQLDALVVGVDLLMVGLDTPDDATAVKAVALSLLEEAAGDPGWLPAVLATALLRMARAGVSDVAG